MRTLFIIKRICKQVLRDKRTLALLFLAPIFVITLLNYIFPDPDDEVTIATVHVDPDIISVLEENQVIVQEETDIDPKAYLEAGHANGVLEEKDGEWTLTIVNDNPINEGPILQKSTQAVMEHNINELVDHIDEAVTKMNEFSAGIEDVLTQLPPEMQPDLDTAPDLQTDTELGIEEEALTVDYVYGDDRYSFFNIINPILVSFFVFFFVFLIAGMAMLKERSSGTLEKLLSTPIRKSELVFGYLFGYGIFAVLQTAVIILFSIYILDMEVAGSIIDMFIINILLSFVALGLGLLLSTFVRSEFQMMQFIPLIIVPQIFFSGMLKIESMEEWLQWLAPFMPLYHAGNAMLDVVLKGFQLSEITASLLILVLFIVIFVTLNILGLRRYRKV
ncbi:ABC transporter permease [Gracilibacillus alcaliphilus]|uniref:ABC transporter permease n=1 Tax=Gracilibacillus alcaliphilus TaxID=1401441 RepID=UPI00195B9DBC|nr:ABC transporter permease [Gracilibacillus alcaliphilus]MBM7676481.1 ABC-2 type transport system permease protein [Gracilibacillus alcaliphilus]